MQHEFLRLTSVMGERLRVQVVGGCIIPSSNELPGDFSLVGDVQNTTKKMIIYQSQEEDVTVSGSGEEVQGHQKGAVTTCGWHILEDFMEALGQIQP